MAERAIPVALLLACAHAVAAAQDPAPTPPSTPPPQPAAQDPAPVPQPPAATPAKPGAQDPARLLIPVDLEAADRGMPVRQITLEDAMRIGRSNNVELRAAELLPQQARQDLLFEEAGFQPELYGDVGYSDTESPARNVFQPSIQRTVADATVGWRQRVITGGLFDLAYRPARLTQSTTTAGFPQQLYTSEWAASYVQPLLRGAWTDYNLANVNAARYGAAQSQHEFDRTVQDTLLAIVEAYWELVFAREVYRVVHASLDVAREQLRITEERIRVRELAPRDRVADEAEVARRREELIRADNAIRDREDDLRRLLFEDQQGTLWHWNLRPTSPIEVEVDAEEHPFEPFAERALAERPDLRALRSSVAVAEVIELQTERDLLPAVDLVGSYSSDGARDSFDDAWSDSTDQQYPDWALRLVFSIPIGNQAARSRQTKASLEVERRKRILYGAMMDVSKEVREEVRNVRSSAEAIRASAELVRLAESTLETEQVKLRVGASTAFEVQRRNQELQESRNRHLRNLVNYRIAESRLKHAQGILDVPRE